MDISEMTEDERVYLSLKSLYSGFGYRQYRMRKFEEYSLYSENKNFLQSEDIITFSDRSGKLLALKPDVTLSIVKNSKAGKNSCRKLYYRESVYRLDKGNNQFKEISQIGLEYLGEIDGYAQLEVLTLAAESLKAVGGGYIIDISHMGVIEGIMAECGLSYCPAAVAECLKQKNMHDLPSVCLAAGISEEVTKRLCTVMGAGGGYKQKLAVLKDNFTNDKCLSAASELYNLFAWLEQSGYGGAFRLDFSVINDTAYYNGVVFQGYLDQFPKTVLSGGRYDNLIKKFRSGFGGMGFALYPDELNYYYQKQPEYDADILLLYGADSSPADVLNRADELIKQGNTVRVAKTPPECMRFGKTVRI